MSVLEGSNNKSEFNKSIFELESLVQTSGGVELVLAAGIDTLKRYKILESVLQKFYLFEIHKNHLG